MRKQALVLAGIAAGLALLAGCNHNKSSGSMGATSGGACCKEGAAKCDAEKNKGAMGAVSGQKAGTCSEKAAQCEAAKAKGNMGAVSGQKAGCCKGADQATK